MRPQLLDRFGMSVSVSTMMDVDVRTQMVLDRLAYEQVRFKSGGGPSTDAGPSCGMNPLSRCLSRCRRPLPGSQRLSSSCCAHCMQGCLR